MAICNINKSLCWYININSGFSYRSKEREKKYENNQIQGRTTVYWTSLPCLSCAVVNVNKYWTEYIVFFYLFKVHILFISSTSHFIFGITLFLLHHNVSHSSLRSAGEISYFDALLSPCICVVIMMLLVIYIVSTTFVFILTIFKFCS